MRKLFAFGSIVAISLAGNISPVNAQATSPDPATQPAQTQPTRREILEACVQNRAETLPNPYTDVSPDHWAYKAVLTMYYCGAFRQATPPSLIEQTNSPTPDRPAQQS